MSIAAIFYGRRRWGGVSAALLLVCALLAGKASAQQAAEVGAEQAVQQQAAISLQPLSEQDKAQLDQQLEEIHLNFANISELEVRLRADTTMVQEVIFVRLDRSWMATFYLFVEHAKRVAVLRDQGFDVAQYQAKVLRFFADVPLRVREIVGRVNTRIVVPDPSKTAAEQAALDQRFFAELAAVSAAYGAMQEAINAANLFSVDITADEDFLRQRLGEAMANMSIFLDLTQMTAAGLRSGVAVSPDDKELAAKLAITNLRVKKIAERMEQTLPMLTALGASTAVYKQQLLTETGQITTSIFEWDVVAALFADWGASLADATIAKGPGLLIQLAIFLLTIFAAAKLGSVVKKLVRAGFKRSNVNISHLLQDMVLSTSRNVVVFLGVLIALAQLGIELGPLLTGLGIVGFIVGFALQDSLSNFASGMMILFYRPFDVGDTIEAAAVRGQVSHMSLVNTTIRTFDNQSLIIPNNKVWQGVIVNVTDQRTRRVDMTFGVSYGENIDKVEKVLLEVLAADERVLKTPEPVIKLGDFGDSSINILCRPWVKTEDYWNVLWDTNRAVKQAFDREGIVIPFPQRDVHIVKDFPAATDA